MSGPARVEVVIPNWNGLGWLPACLESLARQSVPASITVVDNGSTDGSVAWLAREHPGVRCIALPENRGFSAAVNAGIEASGAEFVFLLNNDTELLPDCVEQLLRAADQHPEHAFFACRMLSHADPSMLDGAGDGYLRGGAGYRLGTMEKDGPPYDRSGPVFGACAGAALYRREMFARIGLFDESFFAYLEDVDLNLRAARAGLACWYVAEARVLHIGSASSGSKINPLTVKLSTCNSFKLLGKHYTIGVLLRFLVPIMLYQGAWLAFCVKHGCATAWMQGLYRFLTSVSHLGKARKQVRLTDRVDRKTWTARLTQAEREVLQSIMRRRLAAGKGNTLLRTYLHFFC